MNHPYLPLTDSNRAHMFQRIGVNSFTELLNDLPNEVLLKEPLNIPAPKTEIELIDYFFKAAQSNQLPKLSFLGAGAYQHYIPAIIDHLISRSEFYTSYTPYQAEISQGVLQAIFEYQTYISELFGLPVTNASLYDGPTALAEAVLMSVKEIKTKNVFIPENLNPYIQEVLKTYTAGFQLKIVPIPTHEGLIDSAFLKSQIQKEPGVVIIQNPNFFGLIENLPELIKTIQKYGSVSICYVHPLTLGILTAPGQLGADIVVGEGQPLGLPLAYGGPYLGLIAASERYIRRMPGRIVGETVDQHGKRAFVLTLQAREQHIRREKATSNICSNETLCAIRAAIYLSVMGPQGLKDISQRAFANAHYLFQELQSIGFDPLFKSPFFMEFALKTPQPAGLYIKKLLAKGILPGFNLKTTHPQLGETLLISATEVFSKDQLDLLVTEMRCLS